MSISEKRTQLYLPQEMFLGVKSIADAKSVSFASVVREALSLYLEKERENRISTGDPLADLIGGFEGEEDLSLNHDKYLYE